MTVLQWLQFTEACQATNDWTELFMFKSENPKIPSPGCVSGYQVSKQFVKPWTKGTGCSVSLLMNETPRQADLMLSHGWGEEMDQVYNMLKHSSLGDHVAAWFCIYANYQCEDVKDEKGRTVPAPGWGGPTISK